VVNEDESSFFVVHDDGAGRAGALNEADRVEVATEWLAFDRR
jgi:hypothetical protein